MIPIFKKLLFATDLSENSRYAFFFAASLAALYEGGITLLHVMEKVPINVDHMLSTFLGEEKWEEMVKDKENKAKQILIGKRSDHEMIHNALEAFSASAGVDSNHSSFEMHEIVVKSGKAVDEIISTAREKKCDVIVIGSHKGLLGTTAVGSTARGVLQNARVPVLVVPPPELV